MSQAQDGRQHYTLDAELLLQSPAVTDTATDDGAVDAVDKILDIGDGFFKGAVIWDTGAMDTTTGDETYDLVILGSNDSGFASGITELSCVRCGDDTQLQGDADLGNNAHIVVPFTNVGADGATYRYVKARVVLAGTSPSLVWECRLGRDPR